jgi:TonB family protein
MTRLVTTMILLSLITLRFHAQTPSSTATRQGEAVLSKLFAPTYPPLARQTRIVGDVDVLVEIREDGEVKSATAVKGHPILVQSAIDSARQSQFECDNCGTEGASLHLLYTFRLPGEDECCNATKKEPSSPVAQEMIPRVEQTLNHITVVDRPICFCDPGVMTLGKVRSPKCLYLWRCSVR